MIGDRWRAFARTLVAVPHQDSALGATRRPATHFDERILAQAGVNLRLYAAVPNYLVGLGLLFTFLGLVAALYFASAGVASASVQDAQGALRDLLGAATFKFVTSIAGLGASIVYSWREKSQLYRVGRLLGRLCPRSSSAWCRSRRNRWACCSSRSSGVTARCCAGSAATCTSPSPRPSRSGWPAS